MPYKIFTGNENKHETGAILDIGYTAHNISVNLNKHLEKTSSISNTKYKRRGSASNRS
jgi:hypothetical protein